eukprot:1646714-Prymnesium_polylepis.1
MEVADDAFDFAQRARSTGGTNDLHTVERDASGQLRKRASIKGGAHPLSLIHISEPTRRS